MNSLICPVSKDKVNGTTVRITGLLIASLSGLYLITGNPLILVALIGDFIIRAFSLGKFSPISYLAHRAGELLKLQPKPINKAPKVFAARVGLVFSLSALFFHPVATAISLGFISILIFCALLESLFDFCVGCVVYTYLVLPYHNRQNPLKN